MTGQQIKTGLDAGANPAALGNFVTGAGVGLVLQTDDTAKLVVGAVLAFGGLVFSGVMMFLRAKTRGPA